MTTAQQIDGIYNEVQVIGAIVALTFIVLVIHVLRHWDRRPGR